MPNDNCQHNKENNLKFLPWQLKIYLHAVFYYVLKLFGIEVAEDAQPGFLSCSLFSAFLIVWYTLKCEVSLNIFWTFQTFFPCWFLPHIHNIFFFFLMTHFLYGDIFFWVCERLLCLDKFVRLLFANEYSNYTNK